MRLMRGLAIGGAIALGLAVLLGLADPERFFRAYLVAYTLWLLLALGCLGIAFIQFLTGGMWGLVTRRVFEAGAGTLPLLAILFVPLLLGVPTLYVWTRSTDALIQHKSVYLNVPFFVVRAVVYFACWLGLAEWLRRRSLEHDRHGGVAALERLQRLSIIGLLVLPLTASFAAIDWWMSLEPDWFSTMYPPMLCGFALLLALAFGIVVVLLAARRALLADLLTPSTMNDLGSLLLAFLMLWAYMTYFQYVLIWSGNLKDEITWYLRRTEGAWLAVAWLIVVVGFAVPFTLLLFRRVKRNARWLGSIAGLLIGVRLIEVTWLLQPSFTPDGPRPDVLLPLIVLGIGGLWLAVFAWRMTAMPLLPPNDPRLMPALEAARATA